MPGHTIHVTSRSWNATVFIVVVSLLGDVFPACERRIVFQFNGPATAFRGMRKALQTQREIAQYGLELCGLMVAAFSLCLLILPILRWVDAKQLQLDSFRTLRC